MSALSPEVVVAGHICLDMFPAFAGQSGEVLIPGKLVHVGPATFALGGAVANTGIALHRLGVPTRLMSKIGNDLFGRMILEMITTYDKRLASSMLIVPNEHSSYSVVLSPAGMDRIFFHYPGTNDTYHASDIAAEQIYPARLFHFGYPPLMRRVYEDGGEALATLLQDLKQHGVATSLDMALSDPASEAGNVDWRSWLRRVLPFTDIFAPSQDEICAMLGSPVVNDSSDMSLLVSVAEQLLEMGVAIVAIKLGDRGLYLRTTDDAERLLQMGKCAPAELAIWRKRELLTSCFEVKVAGTTGAGDCTIAGLLTALLQGLSPEQTVTSAVAVGAYSVEKPDATSGIPDWSLVQHRLQAGWIRLPITSPLPGWRYDAQAQLWVGSYDHIYGQSGEQI